MTPLSADQFTASTEQLREELQELREAVKMLRRHIRRQRIILTPVQPRRFLGQPVTIIATVTDALSGQPLIDAPVTFVSTWGRLTGTDGYTVRQGGAVTLRTDINGSVRIVLHTQTSEPLLQEQQDALEAMLTQLDSTAETPLQLRSTFDALAREYRWEANFRFRQAVDIYFRDFRQGVLDTVNFREHLASWSYFDSTVIAYAREDEAGDLDSQVGATAILDLRFKDWLAPWLDAYLALAHEENSLGADFRRLKDETKQAGPLLEGIYTHVKDFVAHQRGLVGEYVGNKVAENAMRDFLQSGLQDLELQDRLHVAPALEAATGAIAKSGVTIVATVGQTQKDLRKELGGKVDGKQLADFTDKLGLLEGALSTKVDKGEFQDFRGSLSASLGAKLNSITFNSFRSQLEQTLTAKAERAELTGLQSTVDAALAGKAAKADLSALETRVNATLAGKVDTATFNATVGQKVDKTDFAAFQNRTDQALGAKVNVTDFNNALATKTEVSTFNTFRDQTSRELQNKTDKADMLALQTRLDQTLSTKVNITDFNNALATKTDVSTFTTFRDQTSRELQSKTDKNEFTAFQTRVDQVLGRKVDITDFTNALATKTEVSTFNTFREQTNRTLQTKVDGSRFDAFSSSVTNDIGALRDSTRIFGTKLTALEDNVRIRPIR